MFLNFNLLAQDIIAKISQIDSYLINKALNSIIAKCFFRLIYWFIICPKELIRVQIQWSYI